MDREDPVIATRSIAARTSAGRVRPRPSEVVTSDDGKRFWWEYVHTKGVAEARAGSSHGPSPPVVFKLPVMLSGDIRNGKLVKVREYYDLPGPDRIGRPAPPRP